MFYSFSKARVHCALCILLPTNIDEITKELEAMKGVKKMSLVRIRDCLCLSIRYDHNVSFSRISREVAIDGSFANISRPDVLHRLA